MRRIAQTNGLQTDDRSQLNDENSIKFSIVVACRNEISHIGSLLDSVLQQNLPAKSWELIVADGMSDDGTAEVLDEYAKRTPEIRVLCNAGRIVSTGLNAAIQAARGEYIIRMDGHTFYAPDYTRKCIEIMERTGADNVGGPARMRATGLQARAIAAAFHSPFSTGGARFHDPNYRGWVETVPYGCWHHRIFQTLGLFDETLVRNQDDEFNLRLIRAGGRIWQDPAIVSWYSPRRTLAALFKQYLQYGFWKVAVIRKHRRPGSWRHCVPGLFVLACLFSAVAIAVNALFDMPRALAEVTPVCIAMMVAYAAMLVVASVLAASRAGWETLIYLPLVFPTFHFSYGFGFLAGLLRFRSTDKDRSMAESGRRSSLAS
jgi:succinoglycan biosynthesis protein ExoA